MRSRFFTYLRRHHVALLALFLAIGGTSYAAVALPANSVGAGQIKKGAVTRAKVRPSSIDSKRVRDGSLRARDFAAGQLSAGPTGPTGPTGSPGLSASGSDSNDPQPNIDLTDQPTTVLSTTVTTSATSRIVATASVNVISTNKGDAALCYLEAGSGGTFTRISSGAYFEMEAATDVAIPVVGSAVNQPAGTYTVRVQCKEAPGEVRYAAGDLAVVATG